MKKFFACILAAMVLAPLIMANAQVLSCFDAYSVSLLSPKDAKNVDALLSDYAELRAASFVGERSMMAKDDRFSGIIAEEQSRSSIISEKNKVMEMNVVEANVDMTVRDARYLENGDIELSVYEWVTITYDDETDDKIVMDEASMGVKHVIIMDAKTHEILADAYDEGPATGVASRDFTEMYGDPLWMRQSKLSESAEIEEEESDRQLMYVHYAGYDPNACVSYADRYVYNGAAGGATYPAYYNSAYTNFNPYGGDCANYTSQSIYHGGMPQVVGTAFGTNGWFYHNTSARSATWTGAPQLRVWMANNRGQVVNNPSSSAVYKGSPCFYDWANGGASYDHATICVGHNAAGRALINSHNNDYYHWPYNYGGYVSTVQLTPGNSQTTVAPKTDNYAATISFYDGCTISDMLIEGWMATSRFHFDHMTLNIRCVETKELYQTGPNAFTAVPHDAAAILGTVTNGKSCCRFTINFPRTESERMFLRSGYSYTIWVDAWNADGSIGHRLTLLDKNVRPTQNTMTFTYKYHAECAIEAGFKDGDTVSSLKASGWMTSAIFPPSSVDLHVKDTVTGETKVYPANNFNPVPSDAVPIMSTINNPVGCCRWNINWPQSADDYEWMVKGRKYEIWIDGWSKDGKSGMRNRMLDKNGKPFVNGNTVTWNGPVQVKTDDCASNLSFYDGCTIEKFLISGWMTTSRFQYDHIVLNVKNTKTGEHYTYSPNEYNPSPSDAKQIMANVPNSVGCCRFTFTFPRNDEERRILEAGNSYTVWVDVWDAEHTMGQRLTLLDSNVQYGPTEMTFVYKPVDETQISADFKDGESVTKLTASGWMATPYFDLSKAILNIRDKETREHHTYPMNSFTTAPQDAEAIRNILQPVMSVCRWGISWPQSTKDTEWMVQGKTYEVWIDGWNEDMSSGIRNRLLDQEGKPYMDKNTIVWMGEAGSSLFPKNGIIFLRPVLAKKNENGMEYSLSVENGTEVGVENALVSIATYDADGRFVKLEKKTVSVGAQSVKELTGIMTTDTSQTFRFFLWHPNTMRPVSSASWKQIEE